MASRDNDFLSRWSRRKAESRGGGLRRAQPDETPAPAPEPEQAAKPAAPKQAERHADPELSFAEDLRREEETPAAAVNTTPVSREDETEELTEEQIAEFADVDFDKLDYDSDYARFMQDGVPQAIRRRALRALWGSNPILANIDGLNDYDEDFTDAALAVKEIVGSNYTPGRGYLTEEEQRAMRGEDAKSAEEAAQAGTADTDDAGDTGGGEDELAGAEAPDAEQTAKADSGAHTDDAADRDDKS